MSTINTELAPGQMDRQYLEFDLEPQTMAAVEQLAAEEGVSAFEMCAILLRERLSIESISRKDAAALKA